MKIKLLQILSKSDAERLERDVKRFEAEAERAQRTMAPFIRQVTEQAERWARESDRIARGPWFKRTLQWLDDWQRKKKEQLFQRYLHRREVNRANASRPRRKRGPAPQTVLANRGLARLLAEYPNITASKLCDMLEADGRITFDDDDIELRLRGGSVVIRDLATGAPLEFTTIEKTSLRAYLMAARKT